MSYFQMALLLQPSSLSFSLLTSSSSLSLSTPMLRGLSTFSLHRFHFLHRHIHFNPKFSLSPHPLRLPLSRSQFLRIPDRPISGGKVFAMADNSSSSTSEKKKHTNRLASEHSPYLLQHAHNPVNWYPWGEEAFQEARRRDAPIFLSIGYSTCHWCHVMEVESFEDEEVAKLLNDWFVSIKVDREERPDVDKVYMTYVQALYGGGGWPLSAFLSPDLKPLMGGTYFPPEDKYGRPGFKTILRKVKEAWDNKRDVLVKSGSLAIDQLSEALSTKASLDKLPDDLPQLALNLCAEQLSESYDPVNGGFGSAPKFPRPVEVQLMLCHSKKIEESGKSDKANEGFEMVYFTLRCMARGGMHDHIGGGFHRYSVDEYWHVPHFEKMLYDQGQLVNVYLDAYSITKDSQYSSFARDILDYLRRDMVGSEGEIFSAEDADSAESEGAKKKEGEFYVWTSKEIDEILGEHATLFKEHYYVKPTGNCDLSRRSDPHNEFKGKNVLIERKSTEALAKKHGVSVEKYFEILGMCRKKLFDVKSKRPRPHLDDKVIVSWNGLTISAFARASKVLQREPQGLKHYFPVSGCDPKEYLEVAEKAASFIRKNLYNEETHRLQHSFRNGPSKAPGFLDDYAFLISGLLDLYECGGGTQWLEWAAQLQDTQDQVFMDKEGGGYFNTAGEDPSVLLRVKEDHDGAEPSGNSAAAINLVRLSSVFSDSRSDSYRQNAERLLATFETRLREMPMAVPLMCCAADMFAVAPLRKQILLVGSKTSPHFDQMLVAAHAAYDPNKTVIHIDANNPDEVKFWEANNEKITSMAKGGFPGDKVVGLVCQNFTCKAPVFDPTSLEALLSKRR